MNESSNIYVINNLLLHNIDTPLSIQINSSNTGRASRIPIPTERSSRNNINNHTKYFRCTKGKRSFNGQ